MLLYTRDGHKVTWTYNDFCRNFFLKKFHILEGNVRLSFVRFSKTLVHKQFNHMIDFKSQSSDRIACLQVAIGAIYRLRSPWQICQIVGKIIFKTKQGKAERLMSPV